MKGKQIFYWLSLLLCLAVAGCSSDGEDEVTPKDEPGEEGGGEQTGREVWSFDVKVMLDRATFKSYGSSANVVNNKLKQRFKEVRELYHGKKGITYFDADIEFVPFFDETCVYDCSSQEVLDHTGHRAEQGPADRVRFHFHRIDIGNSAGMPQFMGQAFGSFVRG